MPNTNLKITFHPNAILDLDEISDWYDAQKENLGYEFLKEFEKLIALIQVFPKMFPILKKEFRKALMSRFPYVVIYKVYNDEIFIAAVMHCKRNPDFWKER